jgi:hypothetical protein
MAVLIRQVMQFQITIPGPEIKPFPKSDVVTADTVLDKTISPVFYQSASHAITHRAIDGQSDPTYFVSSRAYINHTTVLYRYV